MTSTTNTEDLYKSINSDPQTSDDRMSSKSFITTVVPEKSPSTNIAVDQKNKGKAEFHIHK